MNAIEQIKQALEICSDHADIDGNGNPDDFMRVASLLDDALQSMQGEAVLEIKGDEGSKSISLADIAKVVREYPAGTKLYTQPQSPSVPEGYVLVPVEPTEDMLDAGTAEHECSQGDPWYSAPQLTYGDCKSIYKAMLTASGKGE